MSILLAFALLAGAPAEDVQVPVLAHPVQKGDRLDASDFAFEGRAPSAARGVLGIDAAQGMEAARNLPAGLVLRSNDVMRPQLVRRGEPVTIKIVSGALVITAAGRALSGGGQNDLVRVVTSATNRTVDGVIEGSGTVRIAAP